MSIFFVPNVSGSHGGSLVVKDLKDLNQVAEPSGEKRKHEL